MSLTMKEIAKELGISRTSVSAVLNNKALPRVSDETRSRILELAAKTNYRPNRVAQLLCGKPARIIGMVRYGYAPALYSEVSDMITKMLVSHGYSVYYALLHDLQHERETIEELLDKGAEGFILFHNKGSIKHDSYARPLVLCSDQMSSFDIAINLREGGVMAAKHLILHGHRKLAFISPTRAGSAENKFLGFKEEALACGLAEPLFFARDDYGKDCDNQLISLIKKGTISAALCSNDIVAAYLIRFLNFNGIRVPDDFALTGFDGMSFANFISPPLTTVVQPMHELAEKAVAMLLEKIQKTELARTRNPIKLTPSLHIGESCGCKRKQDPVFNVDEYMSTILKKS